MDGRTHLLCNSGRKGLSNVVDCGLKIMVGIIAVILAAFAAYQASSVLAPFVLALFIMAIVWPLQCHLQSRMPKLVALAITIVVTVAVCLAFASVAVWDSAVWVVR
jgi:AI-2 transport protein TqsA